MLWIQGILHLLLIFHFPRDTTNDAALRKKLSRLSVSPQTYSFDRFKQSSVVYLKIPVRWASSFTAAQSTSWLYVGSTSVGMVARENNRRAKIKQCKQGQYVQVEPAIRLWASRFDYSAYSTVVLSTHDNYKQAWIAEHVLIDLWQPRLNHPFVHKFFKKTASGPKTVPLRNKSSTSHNYFRLFCKLRRRFATVGYKVPPTLSKPKAFDILYDLAQMDRRSFEAAKLIRSQRITELELYALWRIGCNLEQPEKSRVKKLMCSAFRFRGCSIPDVHPRLRCPYLAHPSFQWEVSAWLRQQIKRYKQWMLPFHLPSHWIDEGAHQSVQTIFYNFAQWETRMQDLEPSSLPCSCQEVLLHHPYLHTVDGHIASSAADLSLPREVLDMLSFSSSSPVFPTLESFLRLHKRRIDRWFDRQGFPPCVKDEFWNTVFPNQWASHVQHLCRCDFLLQEHKLVDVKKQLHSKLVFHLADHQATHLMLYCPQFYFKGVLAVWKDASNFRQILSSPERCRLQVRENIPGFIRKKYAWGIASNAPLPRGFVFLKQKKDYKKGRSVIAYNGTISERLQRAAASAIEQMIQLCFPDHFGSVPLPVIWSKLQQYFEETPDDVTLTLTNDDLVGFFNSVPQARILQSVQVLLSRFSQLSECSHITVCISRGRRDIKSVAGRTQMAGDPKWWKQLELADIPHIVQATFACGVFTACGACWQQHDGTCIGNQISPILSSLPVLCTEIGWQRLFASQALNKLTFIVRYVDNRLILLPSQMIQLHSVLALLDPWFYGAPIQLEDVGDQHFLGFNVDHVSRSISYIPLSFRWQVRHPHSAGSIKLRLSGLKSRLHSIRTYAWPPWDRETQTDLIKRFHINAGYDPADVLPL